MNSGTRFKPRPKRTPPAPRPSALCVAALVYARQEGRGRLKLTGGPVVAEGVRLGLVERIDGRLELNLRGQDVADEAIALAATIAKGQPFPPRNAAHRKRTTL